MFFFFWSAAQEGVQGECYTEHKWKRCSMVSPVYSSWTQNHKWPLNCTERVVCAQYFSSTPSAMSDLWTAQKESCVCNTSTQPPVQWVTSGLHKKSSVCAIPQLKLHAMSDLWTAQKESSPYINTTSWSQASVASAVWTCHCRLNRNTGRVN